LVGQVHLHQHVAGEELAFGVDLAAPADLDHVFGRHQDFREFIVQALIVGLLADALGHLLLEVRVGVDDVPLVARVRGGFGVHDCPQLPSRVMPWMPRFMAKSTTNRNSDTTTTMMNTITEVIQVSLREVQVTLRASARTSAKNSPGLNGFFGAEG